LNLDQFEDIADGNHRHTPHPRQTLSEPKVWRVMGQAISKK